VKYTSAMGKAMAEAKRMKTMRGKEFREISIEQPQVNEDCQNKQAKAL